VRQAASKMPENGLMKPFWIHGLSHPGAY